MHNFSLKVAKLSAKRVFSVHDISHRLMGENVSEQSAFPVVLDASKGAHFSLSPCIVLNHELHDWENWKRMGERLKDLSEDSKGIQILITILQHPSSSSYISCWECNNFGFPQLEHRLAQHCVSPYVFLCLSVSQSLLFSLSLTNTSTATGSLFRLHRS